MLYLTAQQKKDSGDGRMYMSNRHVLLGPGTPMLSTTKMKATDIKAPKDVSVEHYKINKENIFVRSGTDQDLEDIHALSSESIFPIVAIDLAENSASVVVNVRSDTNRARYRNVGNSETLNVSINKSIEYIKCDLDRKAFPGGVKDLAVMFAL